MEPQLKRRIIGAVITLVAIALLVPAFLDHSRQEKVMANNVPEMPDIPAWAQSDNTERSRIELEQLASGEAEKSLLPAEKELPTEDEKSPIPKHQPGLDDNNNAVAWVVRVGAFSDRNNANSFRNQLRAKGFDAFTAELSSKKLTGVYVGPVLTKNAAEKLRGKLKNKLNASEPYPLLRWKPGQ